MTDEKTALVDKWVADLEPTYPIVILENGDFESFIGVKFFPTAAVIGPDGNLKFSGSTGDYAGPLGSALAKAKKGSIWPKSVAKAAKYIQKGDLAKGYGEVLKLITSGKLADGDLVIAQGFQSYLEGMASRALASAQGQAEDGFLFNAVQTAAPFADAKPPFPASAECAALLTELAASEGYKKELKGGEKYAGALALLDEGDHAGAFKAFKGVMKKYKGTSIAEHALSRAREIRDGGMIGYRSSCTICRDRRKACAKHEEKVKL